MLGHEIDLRFEEKVLRIFDRNGDPWFVLADVCRALEIKNPRDVAARLDEDEKGVVLTDTLGGRQEMTIISEPALHIVVLRSKQAVTPGTFAHRFRRWLTHDVIPSIRKHGMYPPPSIVLPQVETLAAAGTMGGRLLEECDRCAQRTGGFASGRDIALLLMSKNTITGLQRGDGGVRRIMKDPATLDMMVGNEFDLKYILLGIRSDYEHGKRLLELARTNSARQPLLS